MQEKESHCFTPVGIFFGSLQLLVPLLLLQPQLLYGKKKSQELEVAKKDALRCDGVSLFFMHSTSFQLRSVPLSQARLSPCPSCLFLSSFPGLPLPAPPPRPQTHPPQLPVPTTSLPFSRLSCHFKASSLFPLLLPTPTVQTCLVFQQQRPFCFSCARHTSYALC